jgi:hypothetical protein
MIQLNNPRNNFVDLKDSACPGEFCNENQTVCIETLYLRMNSAARYNSSIQCFFLTLAIGIYMLKSLGSVNKLFNRNFQVKFGRILDWYFINQFQFGSSYKTIINLLHLSRGLPTTVAELKFRAIFSVTSTKSL